MAIANTALPAISAGLQTGAATSVWVVNSCQLAVLLRLRLAAMGDLWGPRRVLLRAWRWSRLAGWLACAMSPSVAALSVARVDKA